MGAQGLVAIQATATDLMLPVAPLIRFAFGRVLYALDVRANTWN